MATAPATQTPEPKAPPTVTALVEKQVQGLLSRGQILLPKDYAVENALKAAWFAIQSSEQRDKILACSRESQINALYDMTLQGMDVSKKQGYFIPYGPRLMFQRSYMGDIALAQRVRPGIVAYFDVIYKGETIKPRKITTPHGYVTIIDHEQIWPRTGEIEGAYCGFFDENGEHMGVELMTMEQIKVSWRKSKTYGEKSQTFHNEQPDIAAMRTVIRRRCKMIINTSNDAALLESVRRQDEDSALAQVDAEIVENGNGELLSLGEGSEPPKGLRLTTEEERAWQRFCMEEGLDASEVADAAADKGAVDLEGLYTYAKTLIEARPKAAKPKAEAKSTERLSSEVGGQSSIEEPAAF